MAPQSTSNWDPILLISQGGFLHNLCTSISDIELHRQIVSMQALHYLTLSVFIPPLLSYFAEPTALAYEGGAANVGMVMDWREMAGRPTVRGIQGGEWWNTYAGAWSGGKKVGFTWQEHLWDGRMDPLRGWIIAFCWMLACGADIYYLYIIIRRPRLILDFALTLVFNHLVLTTYYSASIPTSIFFWLVMIAGAVMTIIVAEQMCVKREMTEGLAIPTTRADEDDAEEMELGSLVGRRD